MPRFSFKISILFFLLSWLCIYFLGCTNIDRNECKKIHWPTQGFEDGQEGRPSRLSMFLTKCSDYGVEINNAAYLDSYDKGLDVFCSEDSAFSRGFQGLEPENVCSQKTNYSTSYNLGVQSFCSPEFGSKDALEGKPANLFCSSKSKYFSGYQKGLKKYCTSENGYKIGFEGKKPNLICTNELKIWFSLGYKNGRKAFLTKENENIKANINLADKELSLLKDSYTEKLSEAYEIPQNTEDPDLQAKRQALDTEIKLLKEKKSKLEQTIFELQKTINLNYAEIGQINN